METKINGRTQEEKNLEDSAEYSEENIVTVYQTLVLKCSYEIQDCAQWIYANKIDDKRETLGFLDFTTQHFHEKHFKFKL